MQLKTAVVELHKILANPAADRTPAEIKKTWLFVEALPEAVARLEQSEKEPLREGMHAAICILADFLWTAQRDHLKPAGGECLGVFWMWLVEQREEFSDMQPRTLEEFKDVLSSAVIRMVVLHQLRRGAKEADRGGLEVVKGEKAGGGSRGGLRRVWGLWAILERFRRFGRG